MLYLRTLIQSAVSLVVLFLFTKLIGKRQISNLSLFDYINGMVIGSIAAEVAIGIDKNLLVGVIAMAFYGLSVYLIDILDRKSIRARRFFSGTPTVLYENGVFLKKGFQKAQVSVSEFQEMCRLAGCFDIEKIARAQLEPSGQLSLLLKSEHEPLTKATDAKRTLDPAFAPISLIYDGVILRDNVKSAGYDEEKLLAAARQKGLSPEDIFLCTIDGRGSLRFFQSDHLR